jgi:prevent-host-death family protein
MRSFTAREAARNFGAVLKAADDPVAITWHGQRKFVLMPHLLYEAYVEVSRAHFRNRIVVGVQHALARFDAGDVDAGISILRQSNAWARRVVDGKV